jgi:hypothetical protein
MLDAGARRGLVREGDGDLRAEHVLLGETPRAVEFDRGLRELDVADDIAFLVMDLVARGGERFAHVLVRAYKDAGEDPGEDRLIAQLGDLRALLDRRIGLLTRRRDEPPNATEGPENPANAVKGCQSVSVPARERPPNRPAASEAAKAKRHSRSRRDGRFAAILARSSIQSSSAMSGP